MPALGCAASGLVVTARTRSIASSIATGPTLQLQPTTSAPHSASLAANVSGSSRRDNSPSSSIVTCGDHGQPGIHLARGQHRLVQFFEVSQSLENQQIHPAFRQGSNLLAKCGARFFERRLAQRLNSNSQRAHRTRHPDIELLAASRASRAPARLISRTLSAQAVPAESKAVRTESIGFNDFSASLQVLLMHAANQVGLREVQFVVKRLMKMPLAYSSVPIAPSQRMGDLLSRETKSEVIPLREYKMTVGFASQRL